MNRKSTTLILTVSFLCLACSAVLFFLSTTDDHTTVLSFNSDAQERDIELEEGSLGDTDQLKSTVASQQRFIADLEARVANLSGRLVNSERASGDAAPDHSAGAKDTSLSDKTPIELGEMDIGDSEQSPDGDGTKTFKSFHVNLPASLRTQEEILKERNEKMTVDDWTAKRLAEIEKGFIDAVTQVNAQIRSGVVTQEDGDKMIAALRNETGASVDSLGLSYSQVETYVEYGGIDGPQDQPSGMVITLAGDIEEDGVLDLVDRRGETDNSTRDSESNEAATPAITASVSGHL